jgi:hypothetical protein
MIVVEKDAMHMKNVVIILKVAKEMKTAQVA